MAIDYTLVERGNPSNKTAPKKFYALANSKGELSLRDLTDRITEMSTVSSVDTLAVLEALLRIIPKELTNGQIIRLGDLGSFYVTLSGEGTEKEEDFTSNHIKTASIRFRPGKLIKQTLKLAEFKRKAK